MDFNHTEDRQMLSDTLARYLQQRYSMDMRHEIAQSATGWSSAQWLALADLGIIGALFDADVGGLGGSGFDIAVVFEQLGRALVVEPLLGTLMAGRVLTRGGGHEGHIAAAIAGEQVFAFAHDEPHSRYVHHEVLTQAERGGDAWVLTGTKSVIPQLEAADWIVASAQISNEPSGELALFLLHTRGDGVSVRDYPLVDGGRGGDLILSRAPAIRVGGTALPLIEEAHAAGIVALSWEAVGLMDAIVQDTLQYLRVRKQFGMPIGKFQALQHRMADVLIEVEQARSAAINAAGSLEKTQEARGKAISAAKYTIGKAGTIVSEEAIQLHGGIGMTWELPLSHRAKRLIMIGHQLGDEDQHLARYMELALSA